MPMMQFFITFISGFQLSQKEKNVVSKNASRWLESKQVIINLLWSFSGERYWQDRSECTSEGKCNPSEIQKVSKSSKKGI